MLRKCYIGRLTRFVSETNELGVVRKRLGLDSLYTAGLGGALAVAIVIVAARGECCGERRTIDCPHDNTSWYQLCVCDH
jgi:hypothetical protein